MPKSKKKMQDATLINTRSLSKKIQELEVKVKILTSKLKELEKFVWN
jgi:hypothetical protein